MLRWLSADPIGPWNYRSWIFPPESQFRGKAGGVLDLYAGAGGRAAASGDFVVFRDEKPSIQAAARRHPSDAAKPGGDGQLVEHEYKRMRALCYLGGWDMKRTRLFDRYAAKDGIEPFDAPVEQFMSVAPYSTAQRVFVIIDGLHRPRPALDRATPIGMEEPDPRPHLQCLPLG